MSTTFHLLTGEYAEGAGGIADYSRRLAAELASRGCEVHVWGPRMGSGPDVGNPLAAAHLHDLPDRFGREARAIIARGLTAAPGCVLVQYVPNAFGWRGANLPFCWWLWRLGRHADVRVMFHEPYFYFGWQRPLRNGLAAVQRVMAALLLRASPVAYISTEAWLPYLRPLGPASRFVVMPIPATIPVEAPPDAVRLWRERLTAGEPHAHLVGHFGTFGDDIAGPLGRTLSLLLQQEACVRVALMGSGAERFAATLDPAARDRVVAAGPLPGGDIAAALRACDVVFQPYPDGVTTRRTSIMAALANGCAIVTTCGDLTEPVWRSSGAAALTAAGDAQAAAACVSGLLADDQGRLALAARASATYVAEFAIGRTAGTLLIQQPEAVQA